MKGLFELKSAKDLLKKLELDLKQLKADPNNAYAAFNFFVTAEHMPEWVYPGQVKRRSEIKNASVLCRSVRMLLLEPSISNLWISVM